MVIEFSVYPVGCTHYAKQIGDVIKILDGKKIEYQVGPMGTSIRGEWEEIMPVVKQCHEMLVNQYGRVITHVSIDERKEGESSLKDRVQDIADEVGHEVA